MSYLDNFQHQVLGNPEGEKLVFLHGLLGSGINWRKITKPFSSDFHILIFDQRGHGRSFQPPSGYRTEDYALDLKKILQELGWGPVNLVGHSMGGRNALKFVKLYPDLVARLVIVDIGAEPQEGAGEDILKMINMVPVPFATRAQAKEFFQEQFPKMLGGKASSEALSQFFYTNMKENERGEIDWRFFKPGIVETLQEGRREDYWPLLEALRVPTLVVRGERSETLSPEIYQRMLTCNNLLKGAVVAGAGHWVHSDQPEAFVEILKDFLK
jgi:pimeloyl-ACP methyl ester carboxylesterase